MALPLLRVEEDDLSEDALALIEHIGQILAEEYVQLMKEAVGKRDPGVDDEGSNLR